MQDWLAQVFLDDDIPGGGIFFSRSGFLEFKTHPDHFDAIAQRLQDKTFVDNQQYTLMEKRALLKEKVKTCIIVLRPSGVPRSIDPQYFLDKLITRNHLPGTAFGPREYPQPYIDRSGRPAESRRFSFIPDRVMFRELIRLQKSGTPLSYAATYGDIIIGKQDRPSDLPFDV